MFKELVKQSSWYLVGHGVGFVLGLVSFPIWTRYFSVEEYGMYSFMGAVVAVVMPISKFGLPRAVLRFFSEFTTGKRGIPMASYYTTMTLGALALSSLVGVIALLIIYMLGPEHLGGQKLYDLYVYSMIMVMLASVPACFYSFLRVEQRPKLFVGILSFRGVGGLTLSIIMVYVYSVGVEALFIAAIYVQIVMVSFFFIMLRRQKKLVITSFSLGLLVEALRFGIPLVPAELSNQISSIGDRYVIQFFLGPEAVGLYAVAYGLTNHLKGLLTVMMFAVTPMYLDIWEKQGREKTEEFLSMVLDYYLMIAIPGIILFCFFGGDIMVLMASTKYAEAKVLLPYLVIPLVLHGAISIYTAGLFIHKNTKLILYFTLSSGLLNLILNIIMVPLMGLIGAAVATLISYIFLIIIANIFSSKYITINLNLEGIFKYTLASFAAAFLLHFITIELFLGIIIKLFIGLVFYSLLILAIDNRIRQKLRLAFKMLT